MTSLGSDAQFLVLWGSCVKWISRYHKNCYIKVTTLSGKIEELIEYMKKKDIGMMAVSETKWKWIG